MGIPCAKAGASVSTPAVTAVPACMQCEFAVLQGATAALVDPCGKSMKPAVVPFAVNTGPTKPPVSLVVTFVPLSITDDTAGAAALPALIRALAVRAAVVLISVAVLM